MVVTATPSEASASTKTLQRRLNALGCDIGPVDGKLGSWTRSGLIRFQAANHLAQKGQVTNPTRAKLDAATQVRCDRRPVAGGSGSGRRVVVSQGQNYVWLVRPGGSVAAQAPMADNPSVLHRGTYQAGSKCGRGAKIRNNSDTTGRFRLHNFVRFAPCGIGFHQIPTVPLQRTPAALRAPARHERQALARLHPGQCRDVPADLGLRAARDPSRRRPLSPTRG